MAKRINGRIKAVGGLIPVSDSGKVEEGWDLSICFNFIRGLAPFRPNIVLVDLPLAPKSPSGIKRFLFTFLPTQKVKKKFLFEQAFPEAL